MKPALSRPWARGGRAFAILALASRLLSFAPANVHAVTRTWTGVVNGYWSEPGNWSPRDRPQNGDSLTFDGLQPAVFRDQSTNDLVNLQLGSIRAEIHNSPPYHIYGNGLSVSNGISARNDARLDIRCPVTLASNQEFVALQLFLERLTGLSLSGGLNLNGFDLNLRTASRLDEISLGMVSGVGSLSGSGGGRISLGKTGATNTFTGAVNFSGGEIELLGSEPFGFGPTVATLSQMQVYLNAGGGFRPLSLDGVGLYSGSQAWSGPIELAGGASFFVTNSLLLGGPISGPGDLILHGGQCEFAGSADNTCTGRTVVYCTLLRLNKTVGVRAFSGTLLVGGLETEVNEVRWLNDFQINRTTTSVTLYRNALMNLNGHYDAVGALTFNGGTVQNSGAATLTLFQTATANVATATANISGGRLALAAGQRGFHVEDSVPGPDLSINATIMDLGGITKTGAGELDFFQANTYRGATLVQAGTLGVLNNNALGASSEGTTVADGATVAFGIQANTVLEPFTIVGAGVGGTNGALVTVADVWINTNIVLSGAAAIRTEGMNSQIQVNDVSGIGPLTKLGSGRLVLRGSANNTYSGDTLVSEGILDLAKPVGIASVPGHLIIGTTQAGLRVPSARVEHRASFTIVGSVTVNAGGLWDLNGAAEGFSIPALEGRPPLTLNGGGSVQTGAGIFYLPVGGDIVVNPGLFGSSTISGRMGLDAGSHRISVGQRGFSLFGGPDCDLTAFFYGSGDAADLHKDGSGNLRLAGTNTHRGPTLVSAGILQVDGVQPQSVMQVFDGGRLQGRGTVGPIEMLGATATVAPGASPGILTCSDFNFGAVNRGVLQVELNGASPGAGYDQINARGNVRLSGLTLQGTLSFASSVGQQFTIINNDGADAVVGTFEGLPQNASLYIGGEQFTIGYTGGTGNDVVLTRIPTPPLPRLTIQAVPPSSVRLLWPTNATGFSLQSNTNLNTNVWSTAALLPSIVGTNHVALDFTTNGLRFYQLFHP